MDEKPDIMSALGGRRGLAGLALLMAAAFLAFLLLVRQRYMALELVTTHDTATNIQAIWSAIHGSFFTSTIQEYLKPGPHNLLGDQLYFTLLLYAPFWLLFKTPFTLVVVTIIAFVAGAVPIHMYATEKSGHYGLGLFFAASYLFNSMAYGTFFFFGFRPEVLFMPFLLWGLYLVHRGRLVWAGLFFLLVLLTKHNAMMVLALLGLLLVFTGDRNRKILGASLAAGSAVYYFAVVVPLFSAYGYTDTAFFKKLDNFGATPFEVILTLLRRPWLLLTEISRLEAGFLALGLLPVGFLCLGRPVTYVALPVALYNFLHDEYGSVHCGWHWALVVPFVYWGGVEAGSWLFRRARERGGRFMLVLAAAASAVLVLEAGWMMALARTQSGFFYPSRGVDTSAMVDSLAMIGDDASVSSVSRMLWFVADREKVYTNHSRLRLDADYVVVTYPLRLGVQYDADRPLVEAAEDPNSRLHKEFRPVRFGEHLTIFERRDR